MAGVFPTAASPTGSTPAALAPPPGVGTFPTVSLSNEFVKVRWFEENVAEAVDRRWIGMPRGVYLGFEPATTPGSRVVLLSVDTQQNFSLLKVPSQDERVMVDIFVGSDVTLDFTGHNVWPVYVLATSSFQDRAPTQGKIFTRASNASGIDEIVICRVDKVGDDLVIDTTEPTNRQRPTAFQTQPYGYMPNTSIENLATTDATVVEVIAARSSSFTGPHASLGLRLDTDMGGAEMADRLGLRQTQLLSNVHQNRSGTSANVSGSFSETGREFAPSLTIEAGGSESTEGAISDGTRNTCFVINGSTGQRIIDETTREPVYGITSFSTANIGALKKIEFVNASATVTGDGTFPFQAPLEEGDLIQGPDGLFYEVQTFISPDEATLGTAYQGTDDSVLDTVFRRWTIFFFTVSGGTHNILTPISIQFLFPCFFRIDRAIFDGMLLAKKDGERPPLPSATDASLGKALLAISAGLVGSFKVVENAGSAIGSDIHTLVFPSGGVTDGTGGVANISVPGAAGNPGPGANQGSQGPTGSAGFGYSLQNSFQRSPESGTTAGVGPVSESFTVDWTAPPSPPNLTPGGALSPPQSRTYAHVTGGWGAINGFALGFERIHIDELVNVDDDRTRITVRIEPAANQSVSTLRGYMGASQ